MPYDRKLATDLAPEISRHLSAMAAGGRKYDYNRKIVKGFQDAAAIKADGIYGGETRGALLYFAPSSKPPRPFFKPTQTIPYNPPEPEAIAPTPPPFVAASPPVLAIPRPRPAPKPMAPIVKPVVAPPKRTPKAAVVPAYVPPPVTTVAHTPLAAPKVELATLDMSEWSPGEYGKMEELSRDPGNLPWPGAVIPRVTTNKVALAVMGGVGLAIWYGKKKGWFG